MRSQQTAFSEDFNGSQWPFLPRPLVFRAVFDSVSILDCNVKQVLKTINFLSKTVVKEVSFQSNYNPKTPGTLPKDLMLKVTNISTRF